MPVVVTRIVHQPLPAVWARVADVRAHRLPLTTVHTDPGQPRVGWSFRAVTGVGPVRFIDAMVVTRWSPPQTDSPTAVYAVVKTGRLLGGWAEVTLTARGPERTELVWREEIVVHPHAIGRLVAPLSDRAVAAMFRRAVTDMVGEP